MLLTFLFWLLLWGVRLAWVLALIVGAVVGAFLLGLAAPFAFLTLTGDPEEVSCPL